MSTIFNRRKNKNKKLVLHLSPSGTVFQEKIKNYSAQNDSDVFFYSQGNGLASFFKNIARVYSLLSEGKYEFYYFHYVPNRILIFILPFFNSRIILHYWGGDYYDWILNLDSLNKHCVAKSPINKELDRNQIKCSNKKKHIQIILNYIKLRVGLYVASKAMYVISTNKNYRILRNTYYSVTKKRFKPELLVTKLYGEDQILRKVNYIGCRNTEDINILVCHSASEDVNVYHTALLLESLSFSKNINIFGFLSYSGGSEIERNQIERTYQNYFTFAKSVSFEREYLSKEDLNNYLQKIDIAVFSCYRDEGISLLSQFVRLGGLVCFNRASVNYAHFSQLCPNKVLSHQNLKQRNIKDIRLLREKEAEYFNEKQDISGVLSKLVRELPSL